METKFSLLLVAVIFSFNSFAQNEIQIGAKAGGNYSGFHTGTGVFTDHFGFHIGGMAEWKVLDFLSVQGELLYAKKGGIIENRDNGTYIAVDAELDYLEIPIMARIYFLEKMSFDFGPQVGFLLNSKAELLNLYGEATGEEVALNANKFDFGLAAGLSYKFNNKILL